LGQLVSDLEWQRRRFFPKPFGHPGISISALAAQIQLKKLHHRSLSSRRCDRNCETRLI
jgi:hypothetical protein